MREVVAAVVSMVLFAVVPGCARKAEPKMAPPPADLAAGPTQHEPQSAPRESAGSGVQTQGGEAEQTERLALLAGGLLGEASVSMAAGGGVSAQKQILLQEALQRLGVPDDAKQEIVSALEECSQAAERGDASSHLAKKASGLSKIEQALERQHGAAAAKLGRLGSLVMPAVSIAASARLTLEAASSAAAGGSQRALADMVEDIMDLAAELDLPDEVEQHLRSVATLYASSTDTVGVQELTNIEKQLAEVLGCYGLRSVTTLRLEGTNLRVEDADYLFGALDGHTNTTDLSAEEIEAITGQITKARQTLGLSPDAIWETYITLHSALRHSGLAKPEPRLAADAHRLMAGVYFAAGMIGDFKLPSSGSDEAKTSRAVAELGQAGFRRAAREVRKSLELDPEQSDSAKLRQAAKSLEKDNIPLAEFDQLLGLLLPMGKA